MLQRLLELYDPTNPILRPLMIQCRTQHKSNSQNVLSNSVESSDIQVFMFLKVLKILLSKNPILSVKFYLGGNVYFHGKDNRNVFNNITGSYPKKNAETKS